MGVAVRGAVGRGVHWRAVADRVPVVIVHDAIQGELAERGFVTRWVVVAEVVRMESDERELHVHAGNGNGDSPPTWDILGMLDQSMMMVRSDYLELTDADDDDED